MDRLLGVLSTNQQSNISSLVYVQGWNDAWINFVRTNGVGLGFNMMGCTPLPENFAREIIENAAGGGLNDTDGSFLFAKVISEFGLFGLIFYVLIIRLIHKSKFIIFSFKANHLNNSYSFKILILLNFLIFSFVRSTGYFEGGVFITAMALGGLIGSVPKHNSIRTNLTK